MNMTAEQFLQENKELVNKVVRRFNNQSTRFTHSDLLQEAYVATENALDKFDEDKGVKLSTYVYRAIYNGVRDYVQKNSYDLYVTPYSERKAWRESLKRDEGLSDEDKYLREQLDTSRSGCTVGPTAVRLDVANKSSEDDEGKLTLPSGNIDVVEDLIRKEQVSVLREQLETLTDKEQDIIRSVYFDGKKEADIAREKGLSRQRINQISKGALKKLRYRVGAKIGGDVFL